MTTEDQTPPYAFGDVGVAAARLELLNEVFAEPSRALLRVAPTGVDVAVDVGCGPGFSTRLLAEEVRPVHLLGLDTSEAFLERARATAVAATWHQRDVTTVPFPSGPADVIHARFVLSHLPSPEEILSTWLSQLKPDGLLLIHEDDEIRSTHPALVAYEELARSLVAHRGGDLWVGSRLARTEPPEGYEVVLNRRISHEVPVPKAARLFSMNFSVWRHDPYITESRSTSELNALGQQLNQLARSDETGQVVFDLRHAAYRRQ